MVAGLIKDHRLGLGYRDDDPGTFDAEEGPPLVLRDLDCLLLDPAFPASLARDQDAIAGVLLLEDAHLVSHEHLCFQTGLGEGLHMNIGKWDGHNAEAALLRRLGMSGRRQDKERKPDQNYGEKFRHWMLRENRMDCRGTCFGG